MSVALQLGTPAPGGWSAADQRLYRGVSQQRRPPAPAPAPAAGRRFSLITLVNVIHSDRPVFAAPTDPPAAEEPVKSAADTSRHAGGREMCHSGEPDTGGVRASPEQMVGRRSALSLRPARRTSLAPLPPGGAGVAEPAAKLTSPSDPAEVQSEAGSVSPGGAPSRPLHEVINLQTKRQLRTGQAPLDQKARSQLWLAICRHHGAELDSADEYRDTVQQMEGQYGPARGPQQPRPPLKLAFYSNHYGLEPAAVWTAERILAVLAYNNPAVAYSPPLFSVCCLLLHYLSEEDTYNCLCMMLKNSKLGYLVQTKRQCEISWRTLVKLCRKHTKGSMRFLQRHAGSSENVRRLLADWMAWIFCYLPFAHVVRLFDCYLMEGEKVLYRAAMALIVLLYKQTAGQPCREKAGRWATLLDEQPVQDVMKIFCQEIPVTPRKLLKTMFTIRAFSRGTLTSSYLKAREQIRADGGRITFPELSSVGDASCSELQLHQSLPSLASQQDIERCSSTLGIKEPILTFHLKDLDSSLVNWEELLQLWENVPARFALCSPLLLYTSSEHGFSLKTFYQRVGAFEPTVLLLRTTDGDVFGAYCSASWNTRNKLLEDGTRQAYFGTGETFVFALRPERRVYRWVGADQQACDPALSAVKRGQQLFMAADATMITVGGGGGQAIWLDESLSRGRTDRSDTFGNPPLTDGGGFEVACLEVFGFAPS